ncbi:MAG: energy transducer TonB, partial [Acidobacteriota bacterium]|nr:energy transducer TonB [Acidobacteriota bacterium]
MKPLVAAAVILVSLAVGAQAQPAEPVRVGGNIIAPTKTKNVEPVYPAAAQEARVSGAVILEAVIGPDGRVTNVNILRSVHYQLDDAAVAA